MDSKFRIIIHSRGKNIEVRTVNRIVGASLCIWSFKLAFSFSPWGQRSSQLGKGTI